MPVTLRRIHRNIKGQMKFATRWRRIPSLHGDLFQFEDDTGYVHGQYQIANPISPAPMGTLGAVRVDDEWHWVIESGAKGIYVASRVKHAEMWQKYRAGFPIISTWIDEAGEGESGDIARLWTRIEREIRGCKALVFYAGVEDVPLKGAYVEAGMALALGKPVYAVIDMMLEPRSMRPIGSWLNHPLVIMCESIPEALAAISSDQHAEALAEIAPE